MFSQEEYCFGWIKLSIAATLFLFITIFKLTAAIFKIEEKLKNPYSYVVKPL